MNYKADHTTGQIEKTDLRVTPSFERNMYNYSVHASWDVAYKYLSDKADQEIVNADKQSKSAQLFADLVAQNSPPDAR